MRLTIDTDNLQTAQTQSSQLTASLHSQSKYQSQLTSILTSLSLAASKYHEVHSNLSEGLNFYNSLAPMITEFKDQVGEWKRCREIDIHTLVGRLEGARLDESQEQQSTPTRVTRASTQRAKAEKSGQDSGNGSAPPEQGSGNAPPQWGAWSGGAIRFGD